ncbi:MAG: PA14 domain-containing protein [Pirellulales bacterium]|nr:PA14 domain-containing protein [Pirellulales bacterium]
MVAGLSDGAAFSRLEVAHVASRDDYNGPSPPNTFLRFSFPPFRRTRLGLLVITFFHSRHAVLSSLMLTLLSVLNDSNSRAEGPAVELRPGDHVVYLGNTMADRMQHHAWLETYLHALHPNHDLTFRNLGFAGDEVKTRPRSKDFGSPDQWMAKCETDVVFCFFGYNEALRGEDGLAEFTKDLGEMIDAMAAQRYNGSSAPRLVVFSPIAHENLYSPHLPDGTENNAKLAEYTAAMKQVCADREVTFVDLFTPTQRLYAEATRPLTMNGIHLLDHGNKAVAQEVIKRLFPNKTLPSDVDRLRQAVLDKNYHWFSRYRVVDGYNVFGGRSTLSWHGQSNADVMRREMEIFDVMTANRDHRIWAVAKGGDLEVKDDNLPQELAVKTNKQGPLEDGAWPYVGGEEAIGKMTIHQGMEVNLFASEERFPRLVNPVQMAVDTNSRLWVSVWPSYPHWNPTEQRRDALVILPDEDHDGVADELIVFADELNSVTGFEFWNDGVLVAAPPEIWFLKDTDGDDKADVKIRMLQGVSSADTHHSANAVLMGPDGWMYWSRGIFNVANFETPTKTFRSALSGVHRFNPRTFEFEFHFPIGPNPHGDVFDRWGYQFANDGTSGTGSYINIGKGVKNKQWFRKRVRPVPATGLLSGSHFGDNHEGNFLICNAIGVLGVLQHKVQYDGADITAEEIDPILISADPNFRPSDVEVGGDGALYVADWHNTLIGHMQHNMRDPNRDHEHGRIYRVTVKDRPLLKPAKMKGKPIAEVCQHFFASDNGTRYRARLELSGRASTDIVAELQAFTDGLNPKSVTRQRDEAQALLESLWVLEEHRIPNLDLIKKVFQADQPRVRAAAIRTLGHWAGRLEGWQATLVAASRDASALVRAEAVKAAVEFADVASTEVIFEVATRPTDAELDRVLAYAKRSINIDAVVRDAIASGRQLSPAAQAYVLSNAGVADLLKMDKTEAVWRAILSRKGVKVADLDQALAGLAEVTGREPLEVLMELIAEARKNSASNVIGLGQLLVRRTPQQLRAVRNQIESIAVNGETPELKRIGYAAWVAAAGPDDAFLAASKNKDNLRDFLDAVPAVDESVRGQLFDKVRPLIFDLPSHLQAESGGSELQQQGIEVEYFFPSAGNVAMETLDKMDPKATGVVPRIEMNVPQRTENDRFALRFKGNLLVPRPGRYAFYVSSDDGSRIYLDGKLLVNHDGLHGMSEKGQSVDLSAGVHQLVVTYFDNGGGDGLRVTWQGPGFDKQPIPAKNLSVSGAETLHDVAIGALASIPNHDVEKFTALASLIAQGRNRPAAIKALRAIPADAWPEKGIRPLVDNLIGYLSEMPARYRTGPAASDAVALAKSLSGRLSRQRALDVQQRLENLDVRVIAIGTVSHRMIYDKELIAVQAGKPVEFRFSNTDAMPHNFAITMPGALQEVGELAEATGRDADAMERHFIPKSDKVLLGSRLLQPGENQAISFEVPRTPGVYPYVCTYPGHWRRMYGALYVVENLEEYLADREAYLAKVKLPIKDELLKFNTRTHAWKYDELAGEVKELPPGRSWEVGRELFKVASCAACHRLAGEGSVFGPDLAKLTDKKHSTEAILRAVLEPSKDIDEKFQSNVFVLDDGRLVTGMIVEENEDEVHMVINPLAKNKPTVIEQDAIVGRKKSDVSLMPKGLLDKLTREEILDLIAYVYAKGDPKHKLFGQHHHHHH